jgi:hypothetical protein
VSAARRPGSTLPSGSSVSTFILSPQVGRLHRYLGGNRLRRIQI